MEVYSNIYYNEFETRKNRSWAGLISISQAIIVNNKVEIKSFTNPENIFSDIEAICDCDNCAPYKETMVKNIRRGKLMLYATSENIVEKFLGSTITWSFTAIIGAFSLVYTIVALTNGEISASLISLTLLFISTTPLLHSLASPKERLLRHFEDKLTNIQKNLSHEEKDLWEKASKILEYVGKMTIMELKEKNFIRLWKRFIL